jgi:hypothetical protein
MSKILQIYFYVDFVAVAVSPKTIVSEPSFSLTISCNIRYVGLKLWDHSLAQWITFLDCLYHFLLEVEALLAIQGSAWDEVGQFVELVSH